MKQMLLGVEEEGILIGQLGEDKGKVGGKPWEIVVGLRWNLPLEGKILVVYFVVEEKFEWEERSEVQEDIQGS